VTRAKANLKAQRRYSHPVNRSTALICDQTIVLSGFYLRQDFDTPLRGQDATLNRSLGLPAGGDRQEAVEPLGELV
jgi:hypothetical protein